MDVTDALVFDVAESSQIGEARREIIKLAHSLGFTEHEEAKLGLVYTELATNLIKHTPHGGKIIAQGVSEGDNSGIELFSLDSGGGMDVQKCLADGYSSTGTMGTGLGAVRRNSDSFSIYSEPLVGSAVQVRIWKKPRPAVEKYQAGLTVPKKGEILSGDKWCIVSSDTTIHCLLVDGLGHGVEASDASKLAVKRFKENLHKAPNAVLNIIHTSLRGTRGAVGAVAKIDLENSRLFYCGLGNIAALVANENKRKHLTSLNGTLGYEARKFLEVTEQWGPNSILIMHSDGLSSKTFEDIYTIANEPAAIIAPWLYQKHSKGNDDSTVLVCKDKPKNAQ